MWNREHPQGYNVFVVWTNALRHALLTPSGSDLDFSNQGLLGSPTNPLHEGNLLQSCLALFVFTLQRSALRLMQALKHTVFPEKITTN